MRTGRANNNFIHGQSKSLTYNAWSGLKARCQDASTSQYPLYGGRGIKVCDRWQTFANFLADMGEKPPGHSIDRIDNNGNYEPGNCRWATRSEQARNRRSNTRITAFGKTQLLCDWAQEVGMGRSTIQWRIKHGATPEEALSRR